METLRLVISMLLILAGLIVACIAVFGIYKYKYVLNRMHTAALIDTLAIGLILLGLIVYNGLQMSSLKLLLIIIFLWCSSPVSSHLIARFEITVNNEKAKEECVEVKNNNFKEAENDNT